MSETIRILGIAGSLRRQGGFMRAAQTLMRDGSFVGLTGSAAYPEINDFLTADLRKRRVFAQAKAN